MLTLVLVIVVNLALGLLPRVDNFAHIGGLVSGFLPDRLRLLRPPAVPLVPDGCAV